MKRSIITFSKILPLGLSVVFAKAHNDQSTQERNTLLIEEDILSHDKSILKTNKNDSFYDFSDWDVDLVRSSKTTESIHNLCALPI